MHTDEGPISPKRVRGCFGRMAIYVSFIFICINIFFRFRDISIKFPGSCHDALVFRDSELFKRAQELLPSKSKDINGKLVPLMLVGDPAYPLLPWLLKPYTGVLDAEEESFNCYLSSARIVVENSIGRLKARWRCILKRVDIKYTFVPHLVSACCVLHNIVETNKDIFVTQWMEAVEDAQIMFPQPSMLSIQNTPTEDSKVIRDHLKQYMSRNYVLRRSIQRAL